MKNYTLNSIFFSLAIASISAFASSPPIEIIAGVIIGNGGRAVLVAQQEDSQQGTNYNLPLIDLIQSSVTASTSSRIFVDEQILPFQSMGKQEFSVQVADELYFFVDSPTRENFFRFSERLGNVFSPAGIIGIINKMHEISVAAPDLYDAMMEAFDRTSWDSTDDFIQNQLSQESIFNDGIGYVVTDREEISFANEASIYNVLVSTLGIHQDFDIGAKHYSAPIYPEFIEVPLFTNQLLSIITYEQGDDLPARTFKANSLLYASPQSVIKIQEAENLVNP